MLDRLYDVCSCGVVFIPLKKLLDGLSDGCLRHGEVGDGAAVVVVFAHEELTHIAGRQLCADVKKAKQVAHISGKADKGRWQCDEMLSVAANGGL